MAATTGPEGRLLLHTGPGAKVDALAAEPPRMRVHDRPGATRARCHPLRDGYLYQSVILEGRALLLTAIEREAALRAIVAKYDPERVQALQAAGLRQDPHVRGRGGDHRLQGAPQAPLATPRRLRLRAGPECSTRSRRTCRDARSCTFFCNVAYRKRARSPDGSAGALAQWPSAAARRAAHAPLYPKYLAPISLKAGSAQSTTVGRHAVGHAEVPRQAEAAARHHQDQRSCSSRQKATSSSIGDCGNR